MAAARDEFCNTLRVQQTSDALECGQNLRLPLEIHDLIISFLDPVQSKHGLTNCGLVCKYWYYQSRRQLFKLLSITSSAQLHRIHRVFPNKENVLYKFAEKVFIQDVVDLTYFSTRSFAHIALILLSRSLLRIKDLTISQPFGIIGYLKKFPTHPSLFKTKFNFRYLTEFTLSGYSIFFRDLRRLVAGFPSLITLILNDMMITSGQSATYSTSPIANGPPPYLTTVKISTHRLLPAKSYGFYFWLSGMAHTPLTSTITDAKVLYATEVDLFSQLLLKQIGGSKGFELNIEYKWTFVPQDGDNILVCRVGSHITNVSIFSPSDLDNHPSCRLSAIICNFQFDDAIYRSYDWGKLDLLFSSLGGMYIGIRLEILIPEKLEDDSQIRSRFRDMEIDAIRSRLPWTQENINVSIRIGRTGWVPLRINELGRSEPMHPPLPHLPLNVQYRVIQSILLPRTIPGPNSADLNTCALVCRDWLTESRKLGFESIYPLRRRHFEGLLDILSNRSNETISTHVRYFNPALLEFNPSHGLIMLAKFTPLFPNLSSMAVDIYHDDMMPTSFHPSLSLHPNMHTVLPRIKFLRLISCIIAFSELRRIIAVTLPNLRRLHLVRCVFSDVSEFKLPSPSPTTHRYAWPLRSVEMTQMSTLFTSIRLPFYFWLPPWRGADQKHPSMHDDLPPHISHHDIKYLSQILESMPLSRMIHSGLRSAFRWMYERDLRFWKLYVSLSREYDTDAFPALTCFFAERQSNDYSTSSSTKGHITANLSLRALSFRLLPIFNIPFWTYQWGYLDRIFCNLGQSGFLKLVRIYILSGLPAIHDVAQGHLNAVSHRAACIVDARTIASLLPWTTSHCHLDIVMDGQRIPWYDPDALDSLTMTLMEKIVPPDCTMESACASLVIQIGLSNYDDLAYIIKTEDNIVKPMHHELMNSSTSGHDKKI